MKCLKNPTFCTKSISEKVLPALTFIKFKLDFNESIHFKKNQMKHLLSLGVLSLSLLAVSIKTKAQKSEEEAIKKTLQQETISYFHKDYDGWANTWTHDSADYVVRADASAQS